MNNTGPCLERDSHASRPTHGFRTHSRIQDLEHRETRKRQGGWWAHHHLQGVPHRQPVDLHGTRQPRLCQQGKAVATAGHPGQ